MALRTLIKIFAVLFQILAGLVTPVTDLFTLDTGYFLSKCASIF